MDSACAAPSLPTERPPPPLARAERGVMRVGVGVAAALFLSPALLPGRSLSPADLLFHFAPWSAVPPAVGPGPGTGYRGALQAADTWTRRR